MLNYLNKQANRRLIAMLLIILLATSNITCTKNSIKPFATQQETLLYSKYEMLSAETVPKVYDYIFEKIIRGNKTSRDELLALTYEDVAKLPHLLLQPPINPSFEFKNFIEQLKTSIKNETITTKLDFRNFAAANLRTIPDIKEKETAALILTITSETNDYIRKNETNLNKYLTATNLLKFRNGFSGDYSITKTATIIQISTIVTELLADLLMSLKVASYFCGSPDPKNSNYNPAYQNCILIGGIIGIVLGAAGIMTKPPTTGIK